MFDGSLSSMDSFSNRIKHWWGSLPAFSRIVMILPLVTNLASYVILDKILLFANNPIVTVFAYHYWTVFTAPFIAIDYIGFFCYLFQIVSLGTRMSRLERGMGTPRYFVYFMANNILLQFMYIALYYVLLLAGITHPLGLEFSSGLWSFLMAETVLMCNEEPNRGLKYFCFPCEIKSKYYPFIILVLFSIFGFMIDLTCGLIVGYLHICGILNLFKISDNLSYKIDNLCCGLKQLRNYVSTEDAEGNWMITIFTPMNPVATTIQTMSRDSVFLPFTPADQGQGNLRHQDPVQPVAMNPGGGSAQREYQPFSGTGNVLGGNLWPEKHPRQDEVSFIQMSIDDIYD